MKHSFNFDLTKVRAKEILAEALTSYCAKYATVAAPKWQWVKPDIAYFQFETPVGDIKGNIVVNDNTMEVTASMPRVAELFAGKAIEFIEIEIKELLAAE